jgi:hypothetical protein
MAGFERRYPKSLTGHLHVDSVKIEGSERGRYAEYPFVEFCHFYGISPRRYRELFERIRRKDAAGNFCDWKDNAKRPIIDLKFPFYMTLEGHVLRATTAYLETLKMPVVALNAAAAAHAYAPILRPSHRGYRK